MQQKNKLKICFNQVYNNFIEKELSSNQWLSGETINLVQVLLNKKLPLTNGFEDTTLGNLTILTWKNLFFAEFSTKFIEIQGWLLLTFFIYLLNQLSSFNSIFVQM